MTDWSEYRFQRKIKSNIINAAKEVLNLPESNPMTNYYMEFLVSGAFAVINRMYKEQDISLNELVEYLHPLISKSLPFPGK